jgi:hypothetical protein
LIAELSRSLRGQPHHRLDVNQCSQLVSLEWFCTKGSNTIERRPADANWSKALPDTNRQQAIETGVSSHNKSLFGRLLAAVILGIVLLVLSGLIHTAAAAAIGGTWVSLGVMWLVAVIIVLLAVYGARTRAAVWRRMCFINGVASLGLFSIGAADFASQRVARNVVLPFGPVVGVAVTSATLAIIGLILAAVFFIAWQILRHRPGSRWRA